MKFRPTARIAFLATPVPFLSLGLWFVLSLSMACSAAVDLWVQTLIHVVLITLAMWRLETSDRSPLAVIGRRPLILWGVVLGVLGCSTYYSGAPVRSQQEFWNWFDNFLIFILIANLRDDERRFFWSAMGVSWAFLLLWGGWQVVVQHGVPPPKAGLLNANVLGSYLLVPFWWGFERSQKPGWSGRLFTGLVFVLMLLTHSAGALFALGTSVLYFTVRSKRAFPMRPRWILTGAGVCLLPFIWKLLTLGDLHRLLWWKAAVEMGAAHPLIGLGLGTFELALSHWAGSDLLSFYAHNTFLQWGAEAGILGLGGILGLLWVCLKTQRNAHHAAATIGLLIHNVIEYSLILPAHALLFWALQPAVPEKPAEVGPTRWSLPTRITLHLFLLGFAGIGVQRFIANRSYAQAAYYAQNAQPEMAVRYAQRSIEQNPDSAEPFALLARLHVEEGQRTRSRGTLDLALVDTLQALEREPLRGAFWTNAMQLYGLLGFPQQQAALNHARVTLYPYLAHDNPRSLR